MVHISGLFFTAKKLFTKKQKNFKNIKPNGNYLYLSNIKQKKMEDMDYDLVDYVSGFDFIGVKFVV